MQDNWERRKTQNPSALPRQTLRAGACSAEIVMDRRADPAIYHVIIQRQGSPEIVVWAQYRTHAEAEQAAKLYVEECAALEVSRNAAKA